jgi:hypothetical protein
MMCADFGAVLGVAIAAAAFGWLLSEFWRVSR